MAFVIYLPDDIRNALRALAASDIAAVDARETKLTPGEQRYHAGYRAALVAIALAFGLDPVLPLQDESEQPRQK